MPFSEAVDIEKQKPVARVVIPSPPSAADAADFPDRRERNPS
jgi:hypothetical protein